jgi:hypothetical protein
MNCLKNYIYRDHTEFTVGDQSITQVNTREEENPVEGEDPVEEIWIRSIG